MYPSEHSEHDQKLQAKALWRLAAYIVMTVLVSAALLILNVGVVYTLFATVAQQMLKEVYAQKLSQFVLFTGPFLLLFPEWLIYDHLVSPLRHK